MLEDAELLRRYAEYRSEEAFAELVRRHFNLVWCAARRVLGDADLARDAAQTAFTELARQAGKLSRNTLVASWLYRVSYNSASKIARTEARRSQREQEATDLHQPAQNPKLAALEASLEPLLDAAMAELGETDRAVIVLRFLSGCSWADVGAALGSSEDAARKRVSRALERLRHSFHKRGVDVAGGLVAAALSAAGAQTAPMGLAPALGSAALAGSAATTLGPATVIGLMKTKLALAVAAGAMMGSVITWQVFTLHQLRADNAVLQQNLAATKLAPVPPPDEEAKPGELNTLRTEHIELMRLRGEYGQLLRDRGTFQPAGAVQASRRDDQTETNSQNPPALAQATVISGSQIDEPGVEIRGRVTLEGTPPKEIVIQPLMNDPFCGPLQKGRVVTTRHYVVSGDKDLGDVFVYVKSGLEGKKFTLPIGTEPVLDQVGCLFEPYIMGVMSGQRFKIRNSDSTLHNVHSLSGKEGNSFNFAMLGKSRDSERSLLLPELVTVKCDVHSWMFAYIRVFDHPFFALTGKDGKFKISHLPPGKYTLEAFHRKAGSVTKEVTVGGGIHEVDFTLRVPRE